MTEKFIPRPWDVRIAAPPQQRGRYKMLYRPPGFATLPRGISWRYVEMPRGAHWGVSVEMPRSSHTYGVIETSRPLTAEEMETFQIEEVER